MTGLEVEVVLAMGWWDAWRKVGSRNLKHPDHGSGLGLTQSIWNAAERFADAVARSEHVGVLAVEPT